MADLIDRGAAVRVVAAFQISNPHCRLPVVDEIAGAIRSVPTIDAVQIVRCRDCENATMTMNDELKYCKFWQPDGGDALYLPGDFFCSEGKRMDADAPERGREDLHG